MRYPKFLNRFNQATGIVAGALIVVIGLLSTMEGILRGIFSSPTSWSLDVSQYILIWTIFLGTAYAFQERNHVSVDLLKEFVDERWGIRARRIMVLIAYLSAMIFIVVIGWDSIHLISTAIKYNKLTLGNFQIPIVYLYVAILAGALFMLVTVIFIIVDVIGGGRDYL
jgi:TRAP-type C4-dicarboxylate transport system permease small subunit